MKKPIVNHQRFVLRHYQPGDELQIKQEIGKRAIVKNLSRVPYPYTLKDAKEWIQRNQKLYRDKKATTYNLVIEVDGQLAGGIGLYDLVPGHKATLGYWLGTGHWGKGLMTDVVGEMVRFARKRYALKRVQAWVYTNNTGSMRVLEKNGFTREGLLKKFEKKGTRYIDVVMYAKVS